MSFDCSECPTTDIEQTKTTKIICDYDDCSKIFKSKKSLKDHVRIHKNERPYSCNFDTCDKSFVQFSSFQKHQRVHSGEKPYVCETCNLGFGQVSNLRRHERSHTGEKPYSCEICSKTFTTTSNLKQHQQTHLELGTRSKYECFDCGKAYNYHNSLKKHVKVHGKDSEFPEDSLMQSKDDNGSEEAFYSHLENKEENCLSQDKALPLYNFEVSENQALFSDFADACVNNNYNENLLETYNFQFEKKKNFEHNHDDHVNHDSKDCLRVLHDGHIDYLDNCKLQHIKEDGFIEEHQLETNLHRPIPCKPLKEITHVSRLMTLFSQYEELIRKKQLNLTLEMITSSCNIFTCSKFPIGQANVNNQNNLIMPNQSPQNTEITEKIEDTSSLCPCLHPDPPTINQTQSKPIEVIKNKTETTPSFVQDSRDNLGPCFCKETLFLKHVHSENCGHPRIMHQDHFDYLVEGQLHHVHGNHCDDHGHLRVVE